MIPCPCLGKQHYCLPHLYFVVNRILLSWYMFQSWIFHFKEISVCTGSAPTSSEHSSQNCMKGHFSGYGPWVSLNIYSNFSMYCLLGISIHIAQFSWRKKIVFHFKHETVLKLCLLLNHDMWSVSPHNKECHLVLFSRSQGFAGRSPA